MAFKKIKNIFTSHESINKKVFWVVGIITSLFSVVSMITTMVERLGIYADMATFLCSLFLIVMLVITYQTEKYDNMYLIFGLTIILILMPLNFFCCGGIKSGMPLYFIASIVICVLAPEKKRRRILLILGYVSFLLCFIIGQVFPEFVTEISPESSFIDILITFIITSVGMCLIIYLLVSEYETAIKHADTLNFQLEEKAKKDILTGLYNRNALFDYFDSDQFKNDTDMYIALFDVDNFRSYNDNYGNAFGDVVLKKLGSILEANTKPMIGEMSARYGSEEFVYVISADDYPAAVRKADNIRTEFAASVWEGKPGLRVTLSGGIAKCNKAYPDMAEQALKTADEYLFIAKAEGKNRIKRSGSGIVINNIVFRT